MHQILRVVLHPASSVALLAACWGLFLRTSFTLQVMILFFGAFLYMFLRPGARRNTSMWSALAPKSAATVADALSASASSSPTSPDGPSILQRLPQQGSGPVIIVSIPTDGTIDIIDHALAFGQGKALSQSTVMYVCRKPLEQSLFLLPLARLALWLLGGLMEYSRGLLLQLLRRKSQPPSVAIVLLPSPEDNSSKTKQQTLSLHQKGIFAAALKTGAVVVPAIVDKSRSVRYGAEVSLDVIAKGGSPTAVAIPAPDQVQRLSSKFVDELTTLFKVSGFGDLHVV